MLTLIIYIW